MGFIISLLLCFVFFVFRLKSNILSSFLKLISVQWIIVLLLYELSSGFFIPLNDDFYYQFVSFFLSVIFFYVFFYFLFSRIGFVKIKPLINPKFLYFVAVIGFVFSFFRFVYLLYFFGDFYSLRQGILSNNISLYVGYSFPIVAASFFHAKISGRRIKFLFAFLMLILSVISSSKIFLILSLIFISCVYENNYRLKLKHVFVLVVSGFLLFSIMHLLMKKIAGINEYPLIVALGYTFLGYLLGGIAAFQMIVSDLFSTGVVYSSITDLILNIPSQVHMDSSNGWVRTGNWYGNVHSGFAIWYEFNNQYGVVLYGFIIGIIHALIYSHTKKSVAFQFMKAFSLYSIFFIVFYDTYVMSVKLWIAFFIASIFLSLTKLHVNKSVV